MRKILLTTTLIVVAFINLSYSQAPKTKFGKVTEEELKMKNYDKDSSADAVVLFEKGELYFTYDDNNGGFRYVFDKFIRIKIFNKNALHYGNYGFSLYHNSSNAEKLASFKGATYNLEGDDIVKNKVGQRDILWDQKDKNTDVGRIALENVKEGSVIEFEYTIQSDYIYYLQSWQFQKEIPVIWSEYMVTIPEFYKYNVYYNGFYNLAIRTDGKLQENYQYTYVDDVITRDHPSPTRHRREIPSVSRRLYLASDNIPAFKEEPNMPTTKKFLFEIEFELASIQYPRQPHQYLAESWNSIQERLMNDELFGKQLTRGFISKEVSEIISECKTNEEKLSKIYSYVQSNFKWNGNYRVKPKVDLKTVFKEKAGSSAELNLLLVLMLKEADIIARPILISTKNNGMVDKSRPGLNEFNSVICHALLGAENYLLDATDKYSYPNLLPLNCLNGDGRIIDNNFADWYNLYPKFISKQIISQSFTITPEGNLDGKLQKSLNSYFAYSFRKELDDYESFDKYIEEYQTRNHNIEISEYSIKGNENLADQIKVDYTLTIDDQIDNTGNLIMFYPLNIYAEINNPFKAEERKYPIYFDFPYERSYIISYKIPEGYEIESLPASLNIALPENKAFFTYLIKQNGDLIQVMCKRGLSEMLFSPNDYVSLKEFYNKMISKQSEKIILKKI